MINHQTRPMKTRWKSYKEWADSWILYITKPRNFHKIVTVIYFSIIIDLCNSVLARIEEMGVAGKSQTKMLNF